MQSMILKTKQIVLQTTRLDGRTVGAFRMLDEARIATFYERRDGEVNIVRIRAGCDIEMWDGRRPMKIKNGDDITDDFTPHQISAFEDEITKQLREAA